MKEQDLDRLLNQQIDDEAADGSEQAFQKKVRRAMNRTMYGRILCVLLVVALLGTGLYFGASAAVNMLYYRPGQEVGLMVESSEEGMDFAFLLEQAINMNYPGIRCRGVRNEDGSYYTSKGFGRYDVDVSLTNTFDSIGLPCPPTHSFHINLSKLTGSAMQNAAYVPLSRVVDEFAAPDSDHEILNQYTTQSVKEELEKLPESTQLDVSVSLASYLSADEVAELMHTYPGVQFQWLALKGQETTRVGGVAGGMYLYSIYGDQFSEEAAKRYSGYFLPNPDEITGADLEQCLQSRLQLMLDHPDFLKVMSSNAELDYLFSQQVMKQRFENAQNEWACYGMRLTIGRQDLEKLMQQLPMTQVVVNDVKLSAYQK